MAKHIQTIRRQIADKLSVFGYFVKLALKGLVTLLLDQMGDLKKEIIKSSKNKW